MSLLDCLPDQAAMRAAFYHQLQTLCQPVAASPQPDVALSVGLETEYLLIDAQGQLITEQQRNALLEHLPDASAELGCSMLETHTRPVPIVDSHGGLLTEAQQVERHARSVATAQGYRLVRLGTYPGCLDDICISRYPDRYRLLLETCMFLRHPDRPVQAGNITLPDDPAIVMGASLATHLNIQLPAGPTAITWLNRSIELMPYLVALAVNSPLLECRDSGYHEIRTPLWKAIFDFAYAEATLGVPATRVGIRPAYYRDWQDYWSDVGDKLFLLGQPEQALAINMKNFWRPVRLKPCPGRLHDCLLEMRAFSVQPTVAEEIALHLLFFILLHDAAQRNEPYLPIEQVRSNMEQASRLGLDAHLHHIDRDGQLQTVSARVLAAELIDTAVQLWHTHQAHEAAELVATLRQRLDPAVGTPSVAVLHLYQRVTSYDTNPCEATRQILHAYVVT